MMRFRVDPGDLPAEKAARRLGLSEADFEGCKERLFRRGFPQPDPDTGRYDLDAIDAWRRARHPHLFGLTLNDRARDAREVVRDRIAQL